MCIRDSGYDVNTFLLDKLAAENSGVADYIEPKEDLEIKVSKFFTKVNSPVLSDLEIDFGGVQTDLMYPRKLTDIFKGMQLAIIGRYKNAADVENLTLRLSGKSGRENRTFTYRNLDFPMRADKNDFLPRLWATRRVGWLMEQIRTNGESRELREEVVDLGTRFGIVTPYTSYLATDGSLVTRERSASLTVLSPGVLADQSGRSAVQLSKKQNAQQANVTVRAEAEKDSEDRILIQNSSANQFVANKNFINQNGKWVDAEFKQENKLPEVKIKFASNEYFDLINKEPDLAQFFALGKQVIVVWKNKIYRVLE
jgi:Ca-activated chloride channel family protein